MAKLRRPGRSKTKGKKPTKREQAQMLALSELNLGPYEIGSIMGRAPNTIRKYVQSPMFTDPKFQALVEEYKSKELIDLTAMNISARARIHDLIPTMTPIEAIATMDKSFQQRRLLEGRSTENIFSLRRIIEEAHNAIPHIDERTGHVTVAMPAVDKDEQDAAQIRQQQSHDQFEHRDGDGSGQAAETSRGHSDEQSGEEA